MGVSFSNNGEVVFRHVGFSFSVCLNKPFCVLANNVSVSDYISVTNVETSAAKNIDNGFSNLVPGFIGSIKGFFREFTVLINLCFQFLDRCF